MEDLNSLKREKDYLDNLIYKHVCEISKRPYRIDSGWGISLFVKKPKNVYVAGNDSRRTDYVRKGLLNRLFVMGHNGVDVVTGGRDDFDGSYIILVEDIQNGK